MTINKALFHNVSSCFASDPAALFTEEAIRQFGKRSLQQAILADTDSGDLWLSRLPDTVRRHCDWPAQHGALQTTGAELRFNIVDDEVSLTLRMIEKPALIEIYQGALLLESKTIDTMAD